MPAGRGLAITGNEGRYRPRESRAPWHLRESHGWLADASASGKTYSQLLKALVNLPDYPALLKPILRPQKMLGRTDVEADDHTNEHLERRGRFEVAVFVNWIAV